MIHRMAKHAAVVAVALLVAAPTAAQTHRSAFGLSGGWSTYGDLTPGMEATAQLEAGWLAGAQLETWLGSGRVGLRLNGTFTERPVVESEGPHFLVYGGDLDLLVRPLRSGRSRWVAPFIALGAGAAHFDAAGSQQPIGEGAYGDDPVTRAHVLAGLGLDLLPSHRWGLRLEASDQMVLASVGESPPSEGMPQVHNLRFQAGLQLRLGELDGPRVYAGAPAPAPRAPAPERAAPAPQQAAPERAAPAPAAAPVLGAPVSPVIDPEEVVRLERRLERQGEDYARELSRLEQRVTTLEREVRDRPAVAAAPAPSAGAAPRAGSTSRLYTVQWGAFIDVDTAHEWQERLERRELPVWLEDYSHQGRLFKRVRVGALTSRAEAERLGQRLARDYGWSVWVVALPRDARVPANAVGSTVAFLGGR